MAPLAEAVLAVVLCTATVTDLRWRRIPNTLIVLALASTWGAMPLSGWLAGQPWPSAPYLGTLTGFACLLPLHAVRGCAAGDVKLMAVVGSLLGPLPTLSATLWSVLAGGFLALWLMLRPAVGRRTVANLRFMWAARMTRSNAPDDAGLAARPQTAARLPYAVAIAAGTLWSVWRSGLPT